MFSLVISSVILGLTLCAAPGIIAAEAIRRGMGHGFRPALFVQLGSLVGDATWAIIALTGLAFLIHNDIARTILSLIGIVLMLKLAYDAFQSARKDFVVADTAASTRGDFATGAALSLSNPVNIVFWTGIGTTAFAGIPGGPQLPHLITFFGGFMGGAFVWCLFFAAMVAWGRRFITPPFFRYVNLFCGVVLIYFSIQLAYQLARSLV